jgi:hypothetical protein
MQNAELRMQNEVQRLGHREEVQRFVVATQSPEQSLSD